MIITCPNCTTHYNVQPALLGDGSHTRCFNCGYSWFQGPVVSPPPPPMMPKSVMPQTGIMPPPPTFLDAATSATTSPSAQVPVSDVSDPKSDAPKTVNEGNEKSEEDSNRNIPAENLNASLDDTDQPTSIESIAEEGGSDEDIIDDIDPDNLPDPEPIPNVFMPNAGNSAEKKPRSLIKTIMIALVAFLIILVAALVFGRGFIMDMLPFTKEIYATVGLGENLGEGLKIGNAKPTRGTVQGKEALIVTGVITNISDKTRLVPLIKVAIWDDDNNEVQSAVSPPQRSELPAGKRMKFKVTLMEPSPRARRVEVIFAPREKVE